MVRAGYVSLPCIWFREEFEKMKRLLLAILFAITIVGCSKSENDLQTETIEYKYVDLQNDIDIFWDELIEQISDLSEAELGGTSGNEREEMEHYFKVEQEYAESIAKESEVPIGKTITVTGYVDYIRELEPDDFRVEMGCGNILFELKHNAEDEEYMGIMCATTDSDFLNLKKNSAVTIEAVLLKPENIASAIDLYECKIISVSTQEIEAEEETDYDQKEVNLYENEQLTTKEVSSLKYQIPESWEDTAKGDDSQTFYYDDDMMVMIQVQDFDLKSFDEAFSEVSEESIKQEIWNGIESGFGSCEEVSAESQKILGVTGFRYKANGIELNETAYYMDTLMFAYNFKVYNFGLLVEMDSELNYSEEFESLLETIEANKELDSGADDSVALSHGRDDTTLDKIDVENSENNQVVDASPIELSTGQYVVGEDIPAGKYDIIGVEGGNIHVCSPGMDYGDLVNEIIEEGEVVYSNVRLENGCTVEIVLGGKVQLQPK